jgi:hypothetical protein
VDRPTATERAAGRRMQRPGNPSKDLSDVLRGPHRIISEIDHAHESIFLVLHGTSSPSMGSQW